MGPPNGGLFYFHRNFAKDFGINIELSENSKGKRTRK